MRDPVPGPSGGGIGSSALVEAIRRALAAAEDAPVHPDPAADEAIRAAEPGAIGTPPDSNAGAEVQQHRGGPRYE